MRARGGHPEVLAAEVGADYFRTSTSLLLSGYLVRFVASGTLQGGSGANRQNEYRSFAKTT